ncbi:MAG: hypothetical protein ACM3ZE_10320 [Myxococcales bacterium]
MTCFDWCRFFVLGVAATTGFGCGGASDTNTDGSSAGSPNQKTTQKHTVVGGGATQTSTRATGGAATPPAAGGATQFGTVPASGGATQFGTVPTSGGAMPGSSAASSGARNLGGAAPILGGAAGAAGAVLKGKGGSTGAPVTCCAAMPVCNTGDTQLKSKDACPANTTCYSVSMCCGTVWCAPARTQCTALPVCENGDTQIAGACPADASCYERTTCGSTITCKRASCSKKDYNRKYTLTDPAKCAAVRIACETNAVPFSDTCGCGCEQDSSCPESVDCMPGAGIVAKPLPTPDLCTDLTQCPFTVRAL